MRRQSFVMRKKKEVRHLLEFLDDSIRDTDGVAIWSAIWLLECLLICFLSESINFYR